MVRYENKSPKDSDFWGPIQTKQQMINVFYTSLRCKTNPGNIYCVREYNSHIQTEYRCFYNNKLVAISGDDKPQKIMPYEELLIYIEKKVIPRLKFIKCVFDIAQLTDGNFIFVEFNSWETNSGAHLFDWLDSTEILYPENSNIITFRHIDMNNIIVNNQIVKFIGKTYDLVNLVNLTTNQFNRYNFLLNPDSIDFNKILISESVCSNWLVTKSYVYIFNDIWLGRFNHNLKPLNWTRGVFRFSTILSCIDECIFAGNNFYYSDLRPKYLKSKTLIKSNILNNTSDNILQINSLKMGFKYGVAFIAKTQTNYHHIWASLGSDCKFTYYLLDINNSN